MGSGELIASLVAAGLIDEFLLMIHPLVLGARAAAVPSRSVNDTLCALGR